MASGAETLTARITDALAARGAAAAMRSKRYGLWQPVSGADALARIQAIAGGLQALGLKDGDVAGVVGETCAEWVLADLGIMAAGGVAAGLDCFADGEELARTVNLFGVTVLFVAGDDELHRTLGIRDRCPHLRQIIVMHEQWDDGAGADHVIPLAALEAHGAPGTQSTAPASDALAAILLTSGITAPARGAQLTQSALGRQAAAAAAALGIRRDDERLSLTPLHHAMERVVGIYAPLLVGCIVNFPESRDTAFSDLTELQPSIVQAPPQLWARLKSGVELAAAGATGFQRRVIASALQPDRDRATNPITDALVLNPIRRRIGLARARLCISGGAPLRVDVAAWFAALGRSLTDLYGHAETGGAVSVSAYLGARTALDGMTLETCPLGEIRVRSNALFAGYAGHAPRALDDGWWRSGDIALANQAGLAHPQGRRHDLLDKATAPFDSEAALVASPYVTEAFLYRDPSGRSIAAVLINAEAVMKYAQDNSIPFTHFLSLCRSEEIRALIARAVAEANTRAPLKIDDFTLIERALSPGDPEVSATLALRRRLLRPDLQTQRHPVPESA